MEEEESPKPEESLNGIDERVKYAATNIDDLNDYELREVYNQVTRKKMQRKIKRKARIIKGKEKYGDWSDKRKEKKEKKQHIKEELEKLKEKLNGE